MTTFPIYEKRDLLNTFRTSFLPAAVAMLEQDRNLSNATAYAFTYAATYHPKECSMLIGRALACAEGKNEFIAFKKVIDFAGNTFKQFCEKQERAKEVFFNYHKNAEGSETLKNIIEEFLKGKSKTSLGSIGLKGSPIRKLIELALVAAARKGDEPFMAYLLNRVWFDKRVLKDAIFNISKNRPEPILRSLLKELDLAKGSFRGELQELKNELKESDTQDAENLKIFVDILEEYYDVDSHEIEEK